MDYTAVCGVFLVLIISLWVFSTVIFRRRRRLKKQVLRVDPDVGITRACLGRQFKPGMLYSCCSDRLLSVEKMLWNQEDIKKCTTTLLKDLRATYEVFTDDSVSSKLRKLGAECSLIFNLITGQLVTYSKSADYLQDFRKSSRQARVVLRYYCNTKYEELKMVSEPKSIEPELLGVEDSVTHVIVGVEYGTEAYFVFDRDVPDDEDYDEVCRQMVSLVKTLPVFAKSKKILSDEEKNLADQLRYTLYSDIPSRDPENFEDAALICNKILPGFTSMDVVVPKKAWLYPLDSIDKNILTTVHIEQHYADKVLKTIDRFHSSKLRINSMLKHDVCDHFDCIFEQLIQLNKFIKKKERSVKKKIKVLMPQIQQSKCSISELENVIDKADELSISIELWLNEKEEEISQISEYLTLLYSPGVTFLLSQDEFNSFARYEGASHCIISLEFELYQSQADPEKLSHHPFSSDVKSKIEMFTSFARECKEAKCVVTVSDNNTPLQQGVVIKLYDPDRSYPSEFEFPVPVGKPIGTELSWDRIKIKWARPTGQSDSPIGHTVFYTSTEYGPWKSKYFNKGLNEAEIDSLEPNTAYMFKVAGRYRYGHGPDSVMSNKIVTSSAPLRVKIKKDAGLSEVYSHQGSLEIFRLKTKSVMVDHDKMIAKVEFGRPQPSKHTKVVMLMGATGAGKSTLINVIVNNILGVEYDDTFRFILICDETKKSQAHSQTSFITAYALNWHENFTIPFNLVIIDTPGFGDTRGFEQDDQTIAQIRNLFCFYIDQLHAIGFVAQASQVRLTAGHKYIFDSILSIFGNDVKPNIFIMATFADTDKPKLMDAIQEAQVPHADVFTFNSSALYTECKNVVTELYWKSGCCNLERLFQYLVQINVISLSLTCQVLDERKKLEIILNGLQSKILNITLSVESLRTEEDMLQNIDSDMAVSKNFQYKVKVTKQIKKDLQHGTYVTNCSICSFTCHYPCSISDDDKKFECSAMYKGGQQSDAKCIVCPGKCSWKNHYCNPYYFETYEEEETRTAEDLKKRYNIAKNDKQGVQNALLQLHNELADLAKKIYEDIHEARRCTERLSDIALKPHLMSDVEYIDVLIEAEKNEKKVGSEGRVELYSKIKHKAEIMEKLGDKEIEKELKQKDQKGWWKIFMPS